MLSAIEENALLSRNSELEQLLALERSQNAMLKSKTAGLAQEVTELQESLWGGKDGESIESLQFIIKELQIMVWEVSVHSKTVDSTRIQCMTRSRHEFCTSMHFRIFRLASIASACGRRSLGTTVNLNARKLREAVIKRRWQQHWQQQNSGRFPCRPSSCHFVPTWVSCPRTSTLQVQLF